MKLPAFISNNLSLKILSVVMSTLFWLYVTSGAETEKQVTIPVKIVNLDSSLKISGQIPETLDLVLKGTKLSFLSMSVNHLQLNLDLHGIREGSVMFTNLDSFINAGSGVRIARVQPARLEMTLVRTTSSQPE